MNVQREPYSRTRDRSIPALPPFVEKAIKLHDGSHACANVSESPADLRVFLQLTKLSNLLVKLAYDWLLTTNWQKLCSPPLRQNHDFCVLLCPRLRRLRESEESSTTCSPFQKTRNHRHYVPRSVPFLQTALTVSKLHSLSRVRIPCLDTASFVHILLSTEQHRQLTFNLAYLFRNPASSRHDGPRRTRNDRDNAQGRSSGQHTPCAQRISRRRVEATLPHRHRPSRNQVTTCREKNAPTIPSPSRLAPE